MREPILSEVVTQKYLQQKDLDLIHCASKMRNLDGFLQRQGESLVADAVPKATDICEQMGIAIERRICRRRRTIPDKEAKDAGLTLEQEFRREMLAFADSLS